MKPCHICETAKLCAKLAKTNKAAQVVLNGYIDHLKRDHGMNEDEINREIGGTSREIKGPVAKDWTV